jgi:hypothetical protein
MGMKGGWPAGASTVWKMWEPRNHTILWASMTCYRDDLSVLYILSVRRVLNMQQHTYPSHSPFKGSGLQPGVRDDILRDMLFRVKRFTINVDYRICVT